MTQIYACYDCGRPLSDFAPCPDCDSTRIEVKEYGLAALVDYESYKEFMSDYSPLSVEEILKLGSLTTAPSLT